MSDIEFDEADIPSDAFQSKGDSAAICPRSGEAAVESIKAWEFIGFPELVCWKQMAGRDMTPEDYAAALSAHMENENPVLITGFKNREGKAFSAGIKPSEDCTKWEFFFGPPTESKHKCPKSGESVMISPGSFKFAGFPEVRFYKTISSREMSVLDYIELLKEPGKKVLFRGFKSKAGKSFDGHLIFDGKEVKFDFQK